MEQNGTYASKARERTLSRYRRNETLHLGFVVVVVAFAEMGFHDGWGTALDQLVALAKQM